MKDKPTNESNVKRYPVLRWSIATKLIVVFLALAIILMSLTAYYNLSQGQRLVAWGSVVGVIALVISILLARTITRPIRCLTGAMTSVEQGQPFEPVDIIDVTSGRDEVAQLGRVARGMIPTLHQREEKIKHLNLVLRAVRNVNQLITRERDRDRLLKGACDSLIETRGYYSAWIALLDETGALVTAAEAGLGEDFVPLVEQLKRGELAACGQRALRQSEVVVTKAPASVCAGCPLADKCGGRGVMAVRLEYGEKIYGLSSVSVPADFIADGEERDLFGEVAGDIAFALRNIELEEERQRAEERAQRFLEQQIAVNQLALALGETRDLDTIYHTIYEHVHVLMDADAFIVSFYDSETQLIHAGYVVNLGVVLDVANFPPIPLEEEGHGTQSQAIHTGEPFYTSDHRKALESTRTEYSIRDDGEIVKGPPPPGEQEDSTKSALYVPMKIEGQTIGVMQLQSLRLDAYTQEDIDLIAAVANVAAVAVQNARLYAAVQRELTERQRAEEALKEYSERLEEMVEERTQELCDAQERLICQEKLATLGQLAGGVGHELRNPLGVISNAVYFLQMMQPDADETIEEYLGIISSEVRGAEKIISDLLDFSRTRFPDREKIAISDLVAQVLERCPAPDNVEVTTEIAPDLPPVLVDPRQIGQVLGNLVTNAYQAMPDGGRLTIETSEVFRKPRSVAISISDNGCGISEENRAKIFEPLFTTKAKGIGLGLAMSKNLLEANGGSIGMESDVGKGSTFTVRLPVCEERS